VLCWHASLPPHGHARENSFTRRYGPPFIKMTPRHVDGLDRLREVASGDQYSVVCLAVVLTILEHFCTSVCK
jgi:hypothetical protein